MFDPRKGTNFQFKKRLFLRRGQVLAKGTSFLGAGGWDVQKPTAQNSASYFLRSRLQGLAGFVGQKMINVRVSGAHFVTPSQRTKSR
jgi:hypothetical protein